MNKKLLKSLFVGFMVAPVFFMTSCNNGEQPVENESQKEMFNVTFMDGETELKKVVVESGSKVDLWEPDVSGKDFFGWFQDPTLKHKFDFEKGVKKDTQVFGAFVGYQKDERHWAVAGSGRSKLLASSNWGKVFNEEHYLTNESTDKANIYTITMNLRAGDQFQFTSPVIDGSSVSWGHQRGGAYVTGMRKDGVTYFSSSSGLGGSAATANISTELTGKYKFTLTTYPSGDYQEDGLSAAHANRNNFDKITFEYVGEFDEQIDQYETIFYLKGEKITNWQDYLTDYTTMVTTNGVAKLENVYLKASDQFMFASMDKNTSTNVMTSGNTYIKASNLTDESKALVEGTENMSVKEDGYYTFEYDVEAKTLEVTKVDYTPKAGALYIDGSFISWGGAGNDTYLLTNDTTNTDEWYIEVTLAEGDEVGIQFYDKATTSYNGYFASAYLAANEAFDTSATNIVCKTAGTYKVVFNNYSHVITISSL